MFDIGWQELLLIGVVALIAIGPKDLPNAMRTVAKVMRRARSMAHEFRSGFDEMVREAELDELRRQVQDLRKVDIAGEVKRTVDPQGTLTDDFDPVAFAREIKDRVEVPPSPGPGVIGPPTPPVAAGKDAGTGEADRPPSAPIAKHS